MDWLLNLELFKLNLSLLLLLSLIVHNLVGCWCLNSEGLALLRIRERVKSDPCGALLDWSVNDDSPCSWFGVGCSDGRVEFLNLKDLFLEGALAPELGMLSHVKYLILRNNSFSGIIPKEIGELKKLEILDLGYNDLSGKVPPELCNILTLKILVLSNNINFGSMSTELNELSLRSELHIGENVLAEAVHETPCDGRFIMRYNDEQAEDTGNRRLLQNIEEDPPRDKYYGRPHPASPSPSSTPSASGPTDYPPSPTPTEPAILDATPPSSFFPQQSGSNHKSSWIIYLSVIVGVSILSSISVCCVFFCRYNKVVTVRPWVTGLSGQLQKAFVTGVPSLKRSELETACEDFSNIIGTSPDSTLYKGTLSSGVEIAVMTSAVTSAKDWSKHSESQFRKKIATLSKVNHKNFVNLLGYCEEEEPFTRMMVFEYAPNGTLFEHLHVKEAEHLDWGMRLRIAMGMAYCLEHMYQLNPPVFHNNLNSTTVYLTDDYAAKISDFTFWNKTAAPWTSSGDIESPRTKSSDAESNVYNFGLILLEMMTGKVPSSDDEGPLVELSEYMRGVQPIRDLMDPTLISFQEDETSALCSLILSCTDPDTRQRPTMREVTARLREITAVTPDGATPKLSPLWWAELEILPSGTS